MSIHTHLNRSQGALLLSITKAAQAAYFPIHVFVEIDRTDRHNMLLAKCEQVISTIYSRSRHYQMPKDHIHMNMATRIIIFEATHLYDMCNMFYIHFTFISNFHLAFLSLFSIMPYSYFIMIFFYEKQISHLLWVIEPLLKDFIYVHRFALINHTDDQSGTLTCSKNYVSGLLMNSWFGLVSCSLFSLYLVLY